MYGNYKNEKQMSNALCIVVTGGSALFITILMMLMVLMILDCAPFGVNSLAAMDANIQYLDLFAYFKDVLAGKNEIGYTFSKGIGEGGIAIYGYYLGSPFNCLVTLFEKSELHNFFDILVCLKVGCVAFTCAVFLIMRFCEEKSIRLYHMTMVILLSVSYALCQYNLVQASNIMWLDGVYMLPLIWWGVYRIIRGRSSWILTVCTALSMFFNWYTGAINCLFSVVIFLFEIFIYWSELQNISAGVCIKKGLIKLARYGLSLICGVFISAILFVPVILELRKGGKGSIDLADLTKFYFTGEIASVLQGYALGAKSSLGAVSLFCGSIVLIGSICCLVSKTISTKKKLALGSMAFLTLLLFYWEPFCHLFFLLRECSSYVYRYSYVGILAQVFLAAIYWLECPKAEKEIFLPVKAALGFSGVLLILNYLNGRLERNLLMTGIFFCVAIAFAATICGHNKLKKARCAALVIILLESGELAYNARVSIGLNDYLDAEQFASYVLGAEIQAAALENYDNTSYRVSQTSMRNKKAGGLTANYNEPLAYNWWGISSYTSSPNAIPIHFLDKLGYKNVDERMNIVNTSVLGADSLLGVRYILADYMINGLTEMNLTNEYNGKKIYSNPYCLPLCFTYNPVLISYDESNPFVFQNSLYSELMGEDIDLYAPVSYSVIQEGNADRPLIYEIELPEGHYALYGNLPYHSAFDAEISVNGVYKTPYTVWMAPTVLCIPFTEGDATAVLEVYAKKPFDFRQGEEQFYALDLDALQEICSKFTSQRVDELTFKNGHIKMVLEGKSGEMVYTSVPYDEGWRILLNGKKISSELFGECIQVIPLVDGENVIDMKYHISGLGTGAVISCIGLIMMLGIYALERRNQEKS